MSLVTVYLCLAAAILAEVIATITLAASESFSKPLPSIISIIGFVAAFWLLSFPLRVMPTGIVYAIRSGLGIVLITALAWVWAKQALDVPALVGMALITAGVIVMNEMIARVKASFGSEEWYRGLEIMESVRRRSSPERSEASSKC